jgi:hypothetical protein
MAQDFSGLQTKLPHTFTRIQIQKGFLQTFAEKKLSLIFNKKSLC